MIIQCREDVFDDICNFMQDTTQTEPYVVTSNLGYINCFDKDWIFVKLDESQEFLQPLLDKITAKEDISILIGISKTNIIIQKNISEDERYIFIRKIDKKNEMLWGVSSYIKFQ